MSAIQSAVVMLPVSIILAMVFRNIRPRPTRQKLIKDLLVFDVDDTYTGIVHEYEQRKSEMDSATFKSLSIGSAPTDESADVEEHDEQSSVSSSSSSTSSSSASSSSESESESDDERPTDDEFVTPHEMSTTKTTPRGDDTASKPETTADDDQTLFSTAIESDFGSYVGPLPWWVVIIAWSFALLAAVASAFFIILYTFTFGYEKSMSFLVSVLTSFFFGLLLEQPIKILLVAFALAFIFRKSTDIYPSELDIVADHSIRRTYITPSAVGILHLC